MNGYVRHHLIDLFQMSLDAKGNHFAAQLDLFFERKRKFKLRSRENALCLQIKVQFLRINMIDFRNRAKPVYS